MGDRRPLRIGHAWLAAAAAALAMVASPASAQQNCWTDATPNECPNGGWHVLQFKNGCTGGEKTVNVCVKWTSGASNGLVARRVAGRPLAASDPNASNSRRHRAFTVGKRGSPRGRRRPAAAL
jgi:hypothetical protein